MILIWHGAGILVAVIWFVSVLTGDRVTEALFGSQASPATHNLIVEWLAAALTLVLALLLRMQKAIGADPETGQEVVVRPKHTLFWIPVIAWPVIFFVLGIVIYFRTPAPSPAILDVTPVAVAKINQIVAEKSVPEGWHVRIEAYCLEGISSPLYSIKINTELNETYDYQFEARGIKIVVPKRQIEILRGAQLDFGETGREQKFQMNNPSLKGERLEKWRRKLEYERPAGVG